MSKDYCPSTSLHTDPFIIQLDVLSIGVKGDISPPKSICKTGRICSVLVFSGRLAKFQETEKEKGDLGNALEDGEA